MNLFTAADAVLSPCGLFRYRLTRTWEPTLPVAYWILLNPSVADASQDDPTITRCLGFAASWGCGSIDVRNLFAYRATDPRALRKAADPVGPDNDAQHLAALAHVAGPVVAGWGTGGKYLGRERTVIGLLESLGLAVECLGVSRGGHPLHPLYLRSDTPRRPLKGAMS